MRSMIRSRIGLIVPFAVLLVAGSILAAQQTQPRTGNQPPPIVQPSIGPATQPTTAPATSSAPSTTSAPAEPPPDAATFAGLAFRALGPALMSGRIVDLCVNPTDPRQFYIAVGCGGVWKTDNAGVTFKPIFDSQGSYSIGCLAMDPKNPSVVWVGSGENNSQRSVGFGDGVYRSRDGGASWENVGLKESEHIGMIKIDPRDSNVVYVAAQGPLWRSGPERGLYKTTNGGQTWQRILNVSDETGVNEIHLDPRDPDTLYASGYQRRRHVWTLIDGGPESAIYKSTDAGKTWRKISNGLPPVDLGRIGMAISPANPDVVYAIVEAAEGKSGVFRSADRGETWEKRSDYISTSPQYYNELVCDPKNVDHVYSLDTFFMESLDGGKNWRPVPGDNKHVDNHALWIDPNNTEHLVLGCDGGLYETFDAGKAWRYAPNLPITQFYRVTVDNSKPFYYVYGGTQDNNTLGGPSQTTDKIGVANEHWFVTVGGDGFETQIDPVDPNIVYSQWQHGGLVRYDRKSGEIVDVKPRELPGEDGYRWNWDSPLLISAHDPKRLYFAANKVFRTDDRGDSWRAISGDLTRQLDRNQLKVMGRVQPVDAVAKSNSTSFYGNIVSFSESPLVDGLLYVGTDDGLIQISEDGGQNWRKIEVEKLPGIPELTYVSCLRASQHDPNTVYATLDNHKMGDFKPYVMKSTDRGQTWTSIAGDLPPRDVVYSFAEDHVKPDLLFAGTEFAVYFTVDGGKKWIRLSGGVPTIAIKDIDIQKRENDLVLGTFGRGFYILHDYSPLRMATPETLAKDAVIFPAKDALRYIESNRLGDNNGRGTQGATFWASPNPPFGATVTYYLKDKLTTRRERRKEAEKKAIGENRDVPYPTVAELRAEDEEKEPQVLLVVQDSTGATVRRVPAPREKGVHRVTWDLRYPPSSPTELGGGQRDPFDTGPTGPMALPGTYTVSIVKDIDGVVSPLAGPEKVNVIPLELATLAATDKEAALAFKQKVARLQRAAQGASRSADELQTCLNFVRKAIVDTPGVDPALLADVQKLQQRFNDLMVTLRGDGSKDRRNVPRPPSILDRIGDVVGNQWYTSAAPTQTERDAYKYAGEEFAKVLAELRTMTETDLPALEKKLEAAGAPWTPGRLPTWQMEK